MDFYTRRPLFDSFISSKVYTNGWIKLAELYDHSSDTEWSKNLDAAIKEAFPGRQVILYGGRDSFRSYYSGKFPTQEVPEIAAAEGTAIRETVAKMPVAEENFRKGVIYSTGNQWPRVFPTVDIAITKGTEVILGTKSGDALLRFPGGFVDNTDSCLEWAAMREFAEEVPGVEFTALKYVTSNQVNDWRYKGSDKIMTSLFQGAYISGEVKAGDDLQSAGFYPMNAETRSKMHPNHLALYDELQEFLAV